eukprot:CFRG5227T1
MVAQADESQVKLQTITGEKVTGEHVDVFSVGSGPCDDMTEETRGNGLLGTAMNMTNTIIGSGILDVMRIFVDETDPNAFYFQSWFWLLICWSVFAAPLATLKSLWFLAYTSLAAVVCVLWTTFIVFGHYVGLFDPCEGMVSDCQGPTSAAIWDFAAIMRSFPIFVLGYCIGPVIFNIYNSMEVQSAKRMNMSSAFSISLVTILYIIIAICGYLTYGSNVAPNILDSYPITTVASIARIGTAFVVTVSYPLLMHAARDSMLHIIGTLFGYAGDKQMGIELADHETQIGNIAFYAVATVLNVGAFIFSYFQININVLLSITGAIGIVNLSFTIPPIIYWKLFEDQGFTVYRLACIPFILFGVITCGISIWANFS